MRLFKVLMGILVLVPLVSGAVELLFGARLLAPGLDLSVETHRVLDSNLRFFGGLWLGMGVCLIWCLRALPARAGTVAWLWGFIFVGGLGRALAVVQVGWPPVPFIVFMVLELVGAPLFVWWLRSLEAAGKLPADERSRGAT